ncbi:MAG: hypothetical protein KJ638_09700 [Chloroflexi bacterium]|nr:hypothetical protein [Chloroflexota bacterium]
MYKKILVLLVLIPLLLTACGGGQQTPVEEAIVTEEAALAPTNTAAILPTEVPQVEVEAATETAPPASGPVSECTMVSALPDPPAEYANLFTITEDDWVHGSDTAALTIIEYADFQ